MSGGGLSDIRPGIFLDSAQLANQKMMDFFKKSTLEEMRALSFDTLTNMVKSYAEFLKKRIFFGPVVDGYVLKGTFSTEARAGQIADIPYMIGYTANDIMDMTKPVTDFAAFRAE